MGPSPKDFINTIVTMWEGGYQSYVDDAGNWVTTPDGKRIDIGTMRGVTPNALAAHRYVQPWTLTAADMKAVTLDEAIDIGVKHYYHEPKLDLLPWGPATASLVDFGWMSGPTQAVLSMQRVVGAKPADGNIGPVTTAAYSKWEAALGWKLATDGIHDMRASFYRYICELHPEDNQFLLGWLNRDDWASAADKEWWDSWGVT